VRLIVNGVAIFATMVQFFARYVGRLLKMNNGTWRQRMMNKVLRRNENILDGFADMDTTIEPSELQKKLSKDKANLKGFGEEE
jgi:hypothetical protein|tara:strand:- start:23 stop:271 length:249 start_codon:yes stop_codon:yes gene_type:complete